MTSENEKLLERVINTKLQEALNGGDSEIVVKLMQQSNEAKKAKKEDEHYKIDVAVKLAEIAIIGIGVPVIDIAAKNHFAKMCMQFELTDSFTTTPGRSMSSLFRWKR